MAKKRERFQIIHDILVAIRDHNNEIKPTPLLYASNLSPDMHKTYLKELIETSLISENKNKKGRKFYSVSDKGFEFLKKYLIFKEFVNGFGL